jgi:uncharacterized cupin superfamily protein
MPQICFQKLDWVAATTKSLGNITFQTSELQGMTISRVTIYPGGSWSKDLKQAAGTSSCQKPHLGIMLDGKMTVQMDNGNKEMFGPNDVFMVPPGHDAWCEGDQPAVFVEFSPRADYYAAPA